MRRDREMIANRKRLKRFSQQGEAMRSRLSVVIPTGPLAPRVWARTQPSLKNTVEKAVSLKDRQVPLSSRQ